MAYLSLVWILALEDLAEGQTWEACPLGQGAIDKTRSQTLTQVPATNDVLNRMP